MTLHDAFIRLGFWEGRENLPFPLWQQNHCVYRRQIKKTDLSPVTFELSYVPTWRCFLVQYHNVTCNAATGFSTSVQQLHTCECPQCPRAWAGDRVVLLEYFWFLGFFSEISPDFLCLSLCHALSNFAHVVVWTSGLWGECDLFVCTFTLNCRFMSPCEIFSGLLN